MDPVTGLGVAGSVIQVVDFSARFLAQVYKICHSTDREIEDFTTLRSDTSRLRQIQDSIAKALKVQEDETGLTDLERETLAICKECEATSAELLRALKEVEGAGDGHGRLLGDMIWKKTKHAKLQSRLESLRGMLLGTIVTNIHNDLIHGAGKKAVQSTDTWGDTMNLGEWIDAHQKDLEQWKDRILSAVESSHWRMLKSLAENRFNGLDSWQSTPVVETLTDSLLSNLSYREMSDRAQRIPDVYAKTFGWIFSNPSNSPHGQSWSSFRDWLTSQEGLLRSLLHQAFVKRLGHVQASSAMSSKWGAFSLSTPSSHLSWQELSQAFRFLVEDNDDSPVNFSFFIDGLDEYSGDPGKLLSLVHNLASYPNVKVCVSSRPWTVFEDSLNQRPNLMLQYRTHADIALYARGKMSAHSAFSELQEYNLEHASKLIDSITTKASGVFLWVVLVVRSLLEGLEQGDKPAELQERLHELPEELDALFGKILHGLKGAHFRDAAQLFRIFRAAANKPSVLFMSFADDDDHEWVLNGVIEPLHTREIWYRAITMKRRLNSRCKVLLEVSPLRIGLPQSVIWTGDLITRQPDDEASTNPPAPDGVNSSSPSVSNLAVSNGHLLASAEIDYLHRTVKDFLTSSRISKLIDEVSKPCSNARAALFRAYLCYLKIMPVDVVGPITFWTAISRCLEAAVGVSHEDNILCVRYLDTLDDIAMKLTATKTSTGHNFIQRYWAAAKCHWASTLSQGQLTDDFYTLAVRCQLVEYLRAKFQLEQPTNQLATRLLQTAISRFGAPGMMFLRLDSDVRNEDIVQLLLENGAESSLCATGPGQSRHRTSVEGAASGCNNDLLETSSLLSIHQGYAGYAGIGGRFDREVQVQLRTSRLENWMAHSIKR